MSELRRIGSAAEDQAAEFLRALGYTIVTRRHKTVRGEIDLVALDGDEVVFVEVKSRSRAGELAELAVGRTKLVRLVDAAERYLASAGEIGREWRLDVIAISGSEIRHHVRVLAR